MTPVYLTSTYVQDGVGNHKGFEYSRTHNPTRSALEAAFAALEHGSHGLAFASGLAAMDTVLKTLQPGDEVISTNDLYGGSYRLFTTVFAHYGITFHFVDLGDLEALKGQPQRAHATHLGGNPHQPHDADHGHRSGGGSGERHRSPRGGRQHVRLPHASKPARSRRRHGDAQRDQIPGRPLRCGYGVSCDVRRRVGRRTAHLAKLLRRRFGSDGLLPCVAWVENAAPSHAASLRKRRGHCPSFGPTPRRGQGPLAWV